MKHTKMPMPITYNADQAAATASTLLFNLGFADERGQPLSLRARIPAAVQRGHEVEDVFPVQRDVRGGEDRRQEGTSAPKSALARVAR